MVGGSFPVLVQMQVVDFDEIGAAAIVVLDKPDVLEVEVLPDLKAQFVGFENHVSLADQFQAGRSGIELGKNLIRFGRFHEHVEGIKTVGAWGKYQGIVVRESMVDLMDEVEGRMVGMYVELRHGM